MSFIDNSTHFAPNDNVKRKLFSDTDGIHLSENGAKVLQTTMYAALTEETNTKSVLQRKQLNRQP